MEDRIGQRFNKWTIVEKNGRNKKGDQLYSCRCDCGTIKDHAYYHLTLGITTQCKKCRMSLLNQVEDLIGKKFDSWSVMDKKKNEERNEWYYLCICDCGIERYIPGHHLKKKNTTKCRICRNKTHGMSYTDTFRIWTGILRRCLNSNFKAYKYYGGRGIKVCDRWLKFENFLEDMGKRPPKLQIDRIDNNGHYEPGNCRWVTSKVNHSNRNILNVKKEK